MLITFETAQLAKDKLFLQLNQGLYYTKDKEHCLIGWGSNDRTKESFAQYSAPLQSDLQKWLREFHNIDITVYPIESKTETRFLFQEIDDKQYGYYISIGAIQQFDTIKLFSTYEEALEQGLQESLNLLK
jgi:hypothetical protein